MSEETTPLKLTPAPPVRIRGWKDLSDACDSLIEDATSRGYGGMHSRNPYCANVKVRSYGNVRDAIDKIDAPINDSVRECIENQVGENGEWFYDWLDREREYIQHEWFHGCCHSSLAFWDGQLEQLKTRGETIFPHIREMRSKREQIKALERARDEDEMFREAFDSVDLESLQWEGRQSGYITWDLCYSIESCLEEVISACENHEDRDFDYYLNFREALDSFRKAERVHNLNVAVVDYLVSWSSQMDAQEELNHIVQRIYDEDVDEDQKVNHTFFTDNLDVVVTIDDSLAAGNCESGTVVWLGTHFPNRSTATVKEILEVSDSKAASYRACRVAIKKHLAGKETESVPA